MIRNIYDEIICYLDRRVFFRLLRYHLNHSDYIMDSVSDVQDYLKKLHNYMSPVVKPSDWMHQAIFHTIECEFDSKYPLFSRDEIKLIESQAMTYWQEIIAGNSKKIGIKN